MLDFCSQQCIILLGLLGILTYLFAIWSGGIVLSTFSFIKRAINNMSFYEKHCLQILNMTVWSLLFYLFLDSILGFLIIKWFNISIDFKILIENIEKYPIVEFVLLGLSICIFSTILFSLFKKFFKRYKFIFLSTSIMLTVFLWIVIYIGINLKFLFFHKGTNGLSNMHILDLFYIKDIFPVIMFWCYLFFSIAISSSFSVFYLLLRRNKDDYGRDYYKFSIPVSARWVYSYIFGLILLICQTLWFYTGFKNIPPTIIYSFAIMILLIGIQLFLGIKLIKSQHPIRLKEVLIMKPILALFICILFVFINIVEIGTYIVMN